ncbi:MAG TPA: metalloregulator ArsR/SmtB family transcription factor [Rhizomicrobium sp.]
MVKYKDEALGRTFSALSDPTRRAILAQLMKRDGLSVSELAEPFGVTLPAILKHLDVLGDAGLIERSKTGRTVACRLTATPMEEAVTWLNNYQRYWTAQIDRLAAFVEEEECQPSPNPASSSTGTSRPRRRPSTPRGRTPQK